MNPLNELFRCKTTNKINKPNSINISNSKNSTTINLNESFKYFENNNSLLANKIEKKVLYFLLHLDISRLKSLKKGGLSLTKYYLFKTFDKSEI